MKPHKRRAPGTAPPKPGQTRTTIQGDVAPRLPHESDESSDSQAGDSEGIIKQAYEDLRRGVVDVDRSTPMDELYGRTLRSKKAQNQAPAKRRGK